MKKSYIWLYDILQIYFDKPNTNLFLHQRRTQAILKRVKDRESLSIMMSRTGTFAEEAVLSRFGADILPERGNFKFHFLI